MTQPGLIGPSADSWIASIHAGKPDDKPVGAAVVVDARRVLTCAHVVIDSGEVRQPLWVSFPKSDAADDDWRLVTSVDWIYDPPAADVAILMLNQDVPAGVESASLRHPKPNDLAGTRWWAFGFPDGDTIGDCADGLVGAALARGWVRLDTGSKYLVRRGFSGAGLWSPDYGAVVGIVGQANFNGDGRAITLYRIHQMLPAQDLELLTAWSVRAAGDLALADWGWSLSDDPEGVRHWRPRARGVTVESELGYRFRGRVAALTEVTAWLDRLVSDRRVLVVTGGPGVGKSAVLGRVVTTADPLIAAQMPTTDYGVRARIGGRLCGVCQGKDGAGNSHRDCPCRVEPAARRARRPSSGHQAQAARPYWAPFQRDHRCP